MSNVLDVLSESARNLYEHGFQKFAVNGLCKANQRELIAATGMAFKTLIVARDELVEKGFVHRYVHKFRGRRDWYKLADLEQVAIAQRHASRLQRKTADEAARGAELQLPLSASR